MKITSAVYLFFLVYSFNMLAQSTASKQVSNFSIYAPQLDTIKKIWVYLPEDYKTSKEAYPVIYMHDAQNLFDKQTSYVGEWRVDESLDSLKKPEAIIIGIEHGGDKRIDELTPFPHTEYGGGKADSYLEFLVNNLKPHIDTTYRTLADFRNTGIFGSSLGGLISFYASLKYPNIFGMVASYSPSFWFNKDIYEFAKNSEINSKTKFYFLAGTAESQEMVPDLKRMVELLKEKGVKSQNLKVKYIENGKHNETMWSENFPKSYIWLLN